MFIKSKKKLFIGCLKLIIQLGIFILFIGFYFSIYSSLQQNIILKLIFTIIYLWFTLGVNINFILPLLKLIDQIGKDNNLK